MIEKLVPDPFVINQQSEILYSLVLLYVKVVSNQNTLPALTCSKLTIEALKQGVQYVQS